MKFFHLSKSRLIQWLVLVGFSNLSFLYLLIVAGADTLFIVSLLLVMDVVCFAFIKFFDTEDKQERYIKSGYKQLTTTENGENVLFYTSDSKYGQTLNIAVFDDKGYLLRQTRLSQKDITLVETWLEHKSNK